MEQSLQQHEPDIYDRFFGVIVRPQTYLNLVYLSLSFPLGLAYFILLIVGFSVGLGLAIIWIGLLLLALMVAIWWGLVIFERELAVNLLHVAIPPLNRPLAGQGSFLQKIKLHLSDPVAWKGLVYLFLRFPMGIVSFVATVTWFSLTAGLISAPFLFNRVPMTVGATRIISLNEAMFAAFIGVIIGFAGLHVLNALATGWGYVARAMLSGTPSTAAPSAIEAPPPAPAVVPAPEPEPAARKPAARRRARKTEENPDR